MNTNIKTITFDIDVLLIKKFQKKMTKKIVQHNQMRFIFN